MDALIQDLRSGIRQLFRQRGSSIVAVLTLALGIGVSTRDLLRGRRHDAAAAAVPGPRAAGQRRVPKKSQPDGQVSSPASVDGGHAHLAGGRRRVLGGGRLGRRHPRSHRRRAATRAHRRCGTSPRTTCRCTASRRSSAVTSSREDTSPDSPLVALLGYGYWQSRYGGRRDVVGETVRLDADIATIVGVLPAWFNATTPLSIPLRIPANEFSRRGTGRVSVYCAPSPGRDHRAGARATVCADGALAVARRQRAHSSRGARVGHLATRIAPRRGIARPSTCSPERSA